MHKLAAVVGVVVLLTATGCRTAGPLAVDVATKSSAELIALLSNAANPGEVCDELLSRREVGLLLGSLGTLKDDQARALLVSQVLYQIEDDRIVSAFAGRLDEQETEESYFTANYLAKRGHTAALAVLNRHYFRYPVSSWQWSYTVAVFGKYKYKPAAANLVDSLDAASLNVVCAASDALRDIFPDSPEFADLQEARDYYARRLGQSRTSRFRQEPPGGAAHPL